MQREVSLDTKKGFTHGTHRILPPALTVDRISPLKSALGITRVANITGLDTIGIPTVSVYRPNARSLGVSQGKGLTLSAAKASGLMESVESWHAERISLPLRFQTLKELRLEANAVDCSRISMPEMSLFHDNIRILWLESHDLIRAESVWVPFESVNLDWTLPALPGAGCFTSSSNGLASGNHLLEAISHALCELIERDSLAQFNRAEAPSSLRLDLLTVDDASCRDLLDRFDAANVAVGVMDITASMKVPAYYCTIVDRSRTWRQVGAHSGLGCHPARGIALSRALTEAAQSRLTSIAGIRNDIRRKSANNILSPDFLDRIRQELKGGAERRFQATPSFESPDLGSDIEWLLESLSNAGAEQVLVVDLTHEALQIPVVKVIVPGLRNGLHQ